MGAYSDSRFTMEERMEITLPAFEIRQHHTVVPDHHRREYYPILFVLCIIPCSTALLCVCLWFMICNGDYRCRS